MNEKHMDNIIALVADTLDDNKGGPFGAVIVKDNEVIATGVNSVTSTNDPTAHAEVVAIRHACSKLGTFNLSGCEIYTTCEPCLMCLGAIYWARLATIYYGASRNDAAQIGFDDHFIYEEVNKPFVARAIPLQECRRTHALSLFKLWQKKTDKIPY